MKQYSSLHLFQIDTRNSNLEKGEVLNLWKNLDKNKKEIYKKISKSIKLKDINTNNSIDELGFLRRNYISKINREEYRKYRENILKNIMNKLIK